METKSEIHFTSVFWLPSDMTPWDHGRVIQMYSFVPNSHNIHIILMFKEIRLLSLSWLLLSLGKNWLRFFHPKFPFVWVMACFKLTDGEEPFWAILLIYFCNTSSWMYIFYFGILILYFKPFGFHSVAWDYFECHTSISPASFLWV